MVTLLERGIIGSEAVRRVAALTGLDEDAVVGKLMRLWEGSQHVKVAEANAEKIAFWLRPPDPETGLRWVDAFADSIAGFLALTQDGLYRIRGNAKHIEKMEVVTEANRERALRRWKKSTGGIPAASSRDSPGIDPVCPSQAKLNQAKLNQAEPSSADENFSSLLSGCKQAWIESLAALGSPRKTLTASEEQEIARALRLNPSDAETVRLALIGARFEPSTEKFSPRDYVDVTRVLHKDKHGKPRIQKFADYGARGLARAKAETEKKRYVADEESGPPPDPEMVRNLLAKAGFGRSS